MRGGGVPLTLLVSALAGCAVHSSDDAPFATVDVHAEIDEERRSVEFSGDPSLVVHTHAVGIDVRSPEQLRRSMTSPRARGSVGHAWLRLAGGEPDIVCGHTGEYGLDQPPYFEGVAEAMQAGVEDPVAYLWEDLADGRYEPGDGGHRATYACRFQLTQDQYEAALEAIEAYDFEVFSLTRQTCTTFVVQVCRAVGVDLGHEVTMNIPAEVVVRGQVLRFWHDPRYAVLTIGLPDVLERSLEMAVERGYGVEVAR